jgi:hypothetical protein
LTRFARGETLALPPGGEHADKP